MTTSWRRHPDASHVAVCDGPEGFSAIRNRGINAVIWENAVPADIREAIAAHAWVYAETRHTPFRQQLERWQDSFLPLALEAVDCPRRHVFGQLYAFNAAEPMHVAAVRSAAALHFDNIGHFLICQVAGATTEWVSNDARRRKIVLSVVEGAVERYAVARRHARTLPPYSVTLAKGTLMGKRPFLHRAPRRWQGWRAVHITNLPS